MFCPKCGGSVPDDSCACQRCKIRFQIIEALPDSAPATNTAADAVSQGKQPVPEGMSPTKLIVGSVFVLFGLMFIILMLDRSAGTRAADPVSNSTAPKESTPPPEVAKPSPPPKPEPGSQWSYSTDQDRMGRKLSFAEVTSTNTLAFGFPYQGSQHGSILIRKSPQSGTNVMFRIERGQFICGIESCTINVRFDDGPIQKFSATEPSDHGTTTLFIDNETRFLSQLRKAKILRLEATFYQEGRQGLEFDVEGFKWN